MNNNNEKKDMRNRWRDRDRTSTRQAVMCVCTYKVTCHDKNDHIFHII